MKKTLGLDLGSNSLGWAILDNDTGGILDAGVLVFPEGINPADDSLQTPAAIRRAARMARRIKFHRKIRKWKLLSIMLEHGMCPVTADELKEWKVHGRYPTENKAFIRWLKATDASNPYCDRAAAASGPVAPEVLGRALYHLAQRRGFKSSRKDAAEADADGSDDRSETGKVKTSIQTLTAEIRASGCKTLGQYFWKCLEEDRDKPAKRRIRARYTGRIEHYEAEFAAIMEAQGAAIAPDLRKSLHDAIFDQRPLRSQAHLIGRCPFEPGSPRAQIAHPAFEEFRMLAFINNLTLEDAAHEWRDAVGHPLYPLTAADRALVRKAFMKASPTFKFGDIAKLFKKDPRFKRDHMRFHYYRNEETLPSCTLLHQLGDIFGKGDDADPFSYQTEFDALTFYNDKEMLRGWLAKHHPELSADAVETFLDIHPREGNAQYSLKAIRRILPYLREGYVLSDARFFAKLADVIPDFAARKDAILRALLDIEEAYRRERANRSREGASRDEAPLVPLMDRWRTWLEDACGLDEANWKRLYLRDESPYVRQTESHGAPLAKPRLPRVELGMIRNPLVQRSMTTLRRLVNYLGDHGKIDPSTTIRIELARNVNDYATRKAWQAWQKKRQDQREVAREAIAAAGAIPTEDLVDRYILWEEQGHRCLYTGKDITSKELLVASEDAPYDIEHTIPRCQCGDDSLANKTVCERVYNRDIKKGRIPRDCPNWEDEIKPRLLPWREKLEQLEKAVKSAQGKARAATEPQARANARIKALSLRFERDYWRDKLRRFDATREQLAFGTGELAGFKKRQLVDTGIMARHAVDLLKCLYPHTYTVNGTATAFARKAWGIQTDEAKDRTDHTHHATDAMVIAALTPARFNSICSALKDDGRDRRSPSDICPPPYRDFARTVRQATDRIPVKHILRQTTLRQSAKRNVLAKAHAPKGNPDGKPVKAVLSRGDTVRGKLHKETFYGCIQVPGSDQKAFVMRIPLEGEVSKIKALVKTEEGKKRSGIVDPVIRAIVATAVQAAEAEGKTMFRAGEIAMPSGVPIRRVRVYAPTNAGPVRLRDHAMPSRQDHKTPYYVSTAEGSNFRLALFLKNGRFSAVSDNSLSWAQEHKKPGYVPLHAQDGFLGYVTPGTMALVHAPDNPGELLSLSPEALRKRLYKVVKFESTGRMTLRYHAEARASTVLKAALMAAGKHGAGESAISLSVPHELLLLSPSTYRNQVLFEGIHFRVLLDGTIRFMDSGNP
jgi:CRISPR-associated endonuclease Csn1